MPSQDPLTDDELEELERFLLDAEGIDESMDISMLDGFFAAILSGPKTILPSEWLRSVWDTEKGEDSPVFSGVDQAQRVLGLLMRHMNTVATTLLEAPRDYEPLLMENTRDGDPVPVIDEWCMGYMKGLSLDLQGWLPITIGHPDWLSTIMLYGTEEGWEQLKKKDLSIEEHRRLAAGLGDTVRKVHAHFLQQRRAEAALGIAPAAVRREPIRTSRRCRPHLRGYCRGPGAPRAAAMGPDRAMASRPAGRRPRRPSGSHHRHGGAVVFAHARHHRTLALARH